MNSVDAAVQAWQGNMSRLQDGCGGITMGGLQYLCMWHLIGMSLLIYGKYQYCYLLYAINTAPVPKRFLSVPSLLGNCLNMVADTQEETWGHQRLYASAIHALYSTR